jgi:hypothetical protein
MPALPAAAHVWMHMSRLHHLVDLAHSKVAGRASPGYACDPGHTVGMLWACEGPVAAMPPSFPPSLPAALLQVTCTAKTCPGKWMSFNAIFPQVGVAGAKVVLVVQGTCAWEKG